MISWPAVIHHAGHAELGYIADQAQWERETHLRMHLHPQDSLIDASGRIYRFAVASGAWASTGDSMPLDALLDLIRMHAAQAGQCCVAKFSADSAAEAIRMLGAMTDDT